MPKLNTDKLKTAPNGQLISPKMYERLMAFKPVIEKANEDRISRSDLASRLILDGFPMSELTAYTYVNLLGIDWHHKQPYRRRVCRKKLSKTVPNMLKKGLKSYEIAAKVGCSVCTINRFIREAELVADGVKICPKNYLNR
jgi:hypothetical protein